VFPLGPVRLHAHRTRWQVPRWLHDHVWQTRHVALPRPADRGDNRDCVSMPTRRHYRRPNPDRRRALELLAGSRYGYSKAILRAHGFSIDMMVELVKAGLATTKRERMVADGRQTDVVRVRITDAGRKAAPQDVP